MTRSRVSKVSRKSQPQSSALHGTSAERVPVFAVDVTVEPDGTRAELRVQADVPFITRWLAPRAAALMPVAQQLRAMLKTLDGLGMLPAIGLKVSP